MKLLQFPVKACSDNQEGKNVSEADKLLNRFVDVFLIVDIEERKRQFDPLMNDIFDYVSS
jgi:hypothetical protein